MEEHQKSKKIQKTPRWLQEDEKRSPRKPKNTLQVIISQENSMVVDEDFWSSTLGGKTKVMATKMNFEGTTSKPLKF